MNGCRMSLGCNRLIGGLAACAVILAAAGLRAEELEWKSIFNGKNLDGWTLMGDEGGFVVVDGVIRSESGQNGKWLRYDKPLKNFALKVEWRIGRGGSSGICLRSAKNGPPWATGMKVQISNQFRDSEHCTGALYDYVGVRVRPDETADKWHLFEISCDGPRILVLADGVTVIKVDQRSIKEIEKKPLEGYIGLQDSHNPVGYVEFRNIQLLELAGEKK